MRIPSKTQLFIDGLKNNAGNGNRPLFLDETGAISARWQNLTLSSVFQPIYKSNELTKSFAYEAFVRCQDAEGNSIGITDLFLKPEDQDQITGLDRLCRTIHLLNFTLQDIPHALLFLNVNEGLISAVDDNHGAAFRKVIDALGFSSNRIVIELPVSLIKDKKRLHFVLQNYRLNSLEVAINIDSINDLQGMTERANIHYIKIARQLLQPGKDITSELDLIAQLSNEANIILTKNAVKAPYLLDPRILLQGDAYGATSNFKAQVEVDSSFDYSTQEDFSLHVGG